MPIAKTTFAISLEESRYTLNGALLVLKPGSLAMVATDGHRLAMVETDHKFEGFSNETRVLVPKKAMTEVQRLVGKSGDDVQMEFGQDESHLFFQFGAACSLRANSPANSRITKPCCRAT